MGIAEITQQELVIAARIITYGNAASPALTAQIREEIETLWNEPGTWINIHDYYLQVVFRISAEYRPDLTDIDIYQNLDPHNNYFRIEEFAHGNISFVDGIGCNSGYFKLENLYAGSTTAAHEFGHTLGLTHPEIVDIRGKGSPGIMYPRGTLVDPQYQYESDKPAGTKGGTLYPIHRRVSDEDIQLLKLHKKDFEHGRAIIGDFTNIWHPNHAEIDTLDYLY
ncbi:MAG TPA: peptidase M10 [Chitinophagaceae bacterium]|nr:peptidase M10 [Chitinophagaceae bacterium]